MVSAYRHSIVRVPSRKLLLYWVNIESPKRLLKRHPGLLGVLANTPEERDRVWENIQKFLRDAWEEKDPRRREWYLFSARYVYEKAHLKAAILAHVEIADANRLAAERAVDSMYPGPPDDDPFHRAIFDLQVTGAVNRLRKCAWSECKYPYFIRAVDKKTKQPYCSTACHGRALREIQRLWWRNNRGKGARS